MPDMTPFLPFAAVNNKRTSKRSYGFLDKVNEIVEGVFLFPSHTMRKVSLA